MRLNANGVGFSRSWTVGASEDARAVLTHVAFTSPVVFLTQTGPREVFTATLRIAPASRFVESQDSEHALEEVVFGQCPGGSFFIGQPSAGELSVCEISIALASPEFERIWGQGEQQLSVAVEAELPGGRASEPLTLKEQSFNCQLFSLNLRLYQGGSHEEEDRHRDRWARDVQAALSLHLGDFTAGQARATQLSRIIRELALSAKAQSRGARADAMVQACHDLLGGLRLGFRPSTRLSEEGPNIWSLDAQEFSQAVSTLPEPRASELKNQYAQLWQHFNVAQVLAAGEAKSGAIAAGFQPVVSELEESAAQLLQLPGAHSALLEWLLLDALVYSECVAFGQAYLQGQGGVTEGGLIKTDAMVPSSGKQLLNSVGAIALEGLKLLATFAIALALTQEALASTWVVFTGATAVRWIRKTLVSQHSTPRQRAGELLLEMANVSETLKSPQFNARAFRAELYRLAAKGAVFSPWVFHLLDTRIRRFDQQDVAPSA